MALYVGLRRARPVAAIIGYSGMLTSVADLTPLQIARPPVLLIHGTADPVVPVAALHDAESQLKQLGIEVKTHASSGLGHTVDPIGLGMGRDFAAHALR